MNKVAKCKFCKEDKKLIDAHIIPRAFVRNKVKEYNNKNLIQIKKDTIGYKIIKSNQIVILMVKYFAIIVIINFVIKH